VRCGRPAGEHVVLPGRGHSAIGCESFAWAFDPSQLPRMKRQVANMLRLGKGEVFDHCHCLDDADLAPCPHCERLLCPSHLGEHELSCLERSPVA
jgi:hypothetical protein